MCQQKHLLFWHYYFDHEKFCVIRLKEAIIEIPILTKIIRIWLSKGHLGK